MIDCSVTDLFCEEQRRRVPRRGDIWAHFKKNPETGCNNLYRIVTIGKFSETGELMVVYHKLHDGYATDDDIYIRPLEMFWSEVDREKYPDAEAQYRFTYITHIDMLREIYSA